MIMLCQSFALQRNVCLEALSNYCAALRPKGAEAERPTLHVNEWAVIEKL